MRRRPSRSGLPSSPTRPDLFLVAGDNIYGDVRDGRAVPEEEAA
jgi:hypothetical protein